MMALLLRMAICVTICVTVRRCKAGAGVLPIATEMPSFLIKAPVFLEFSNEKLQTDSGIHPGKMMICH